MLSRVRQLAIVCVVANVVGCSDAVPTPVATDPESVKKLEELQGTASKGEPVTKGEPVPKAEPAKKK